MDSFFGHEVLSCGVSEIQHLNNSSELFFDKLKIIGLDQNNFLHNGRSGLIFWNGLTGTVSQQILLTTGFITHRVARTRIDGYNGILKIKLL